MIGPLRMQAKRPLPRHRNDIPSLLIRCSDPMRRPDDTDLPESSASTVRQLLLQADAHGVLPIVLNNLPQLGRKTEYAAAYSQALSRRRLMMTHTAMLRRHCAGLLDAVEDAHLTVVKGDTFARLLYPDPALRPFTDIDLLANRGSVSRLNAVLESQGFVFHRQVEDEERQEFKWAHRDSPAIVVEVHTNLVHQSRLRASLSLAYDDIADCADTFAAQLAIATLHGALHRFEKLRYVVDVCQAARSLRGASEEARLEQLVERTGTRFAAVVALDLAHRFFGEPRCRDIAAALGTVRLKGLARLLVSRASIMSTMTEARPLHSWRRQLFRLLLCAGVTHQSV